MAGWSRQKRERVEKAFYLFLGKCVIDSKDAGRICLGEQLYDGQRYFITRVFDALEADIHNIYCLKSRQLGISTICRALTTFMLGIFPGLKGALVFDSAENRSEARIELESMIEGFPLSLKFPSYKSNREGGTLSNKSRILFKSAGVRESKTSGGLGRSVGLAFLHASELCSWENEAGFEALQNSLSDINPDRLYIYESTARGFNRWNTLWENARADPDHNMCIFLGWFLKPTQRIEQSEPDFQKYGVYPITKKEKEKIEAVKKQYGYDITVEQLAWIRRKMDPALLSIGDDDINYDADPMRVQEQPWTEQEAFQQTGAIFFSAAKLTDQTNNHVSHNFDSYMYIVADEFDATAVIKAQTRKSIELKVWEEPEPGGVYVIGVDPAFGENENNCRSSAEVFRCYADGFDQVAEYAWPLITTQQFAWVIASLLGWYGGEGSECRYILELNGPGTSVYTELRQLRQKLDHGYRAREIAEKGLTRIFSNVRTFLYSRPDSMGHGWNYHWKTTSGLKVTIMEDLRNFVSSGIARIRSMELIKEMATIARDGDSIGAPNSMKDDRVIASALAAYYWKMNIRPILISQRKTRESEAARKRASIVDQVSLFQNNMLTQFFDAKRQERIHSSRLAARHSWRGR